MVSENKYKKKKRSHTLFFVTLIYQSKHHIKRHIVAQTFYAVGGFGDKSFEFGEVFVFYNCALGYH